MEFGGPIGCAATCLVLPVISLTAAAFLAEPTRPPSAAELLQAGSVVTAWFAYQIILWMVLPGKVVQGVELSTKERLPYTMNGQASFWVSLVTVAGLHWQTGCLVYLYEQYIALCCAMVVFSLLLSVWLYVKSFQQGALLAPHASGNLFEDFFMGRELNPRTGAFDWKQFCELRPGLIGWAVMNYGMAAKQHAETGSVSAAMIGVCLAQTVYVWDALKYEEAILTTMDITTDGFGLMLAFGDLAWVPITYGLQARYLADQKGASGAIIAVAALLALLGMVVFRCANGQKDAFRRDPTSPAVQHLATMQTRTGRKLLISGWWGCARKINYTGDMLMGLGWCLFCIPGDGLPVALQYQTKAGQKQILSFFYAVYIIVLLTHRAWRDDMFCAAKYGEDWKEYKKKVPAVFVPSPSTILAELRGTKKKLR